MKSSITLTVHGNHWCVQVGPLVPMHYACAQGHKEIVDILRQSGASFCAKGKCDWTPLHFACESGHVNIVQDILQSGVDINVQVCEMWLDCFE